MVGALVFGAFFLLQGLRNFTASGGQDSAQATQESAASLTEIAAVDADRFATQTARPTPTPIPPCQDFTIRAPMANLRAAPNIDAEALDRLPEGTEICVIQPAAPGEEWHLIDSQSEHPPRRARLYAYLRPARAAPHAAPDRLRHAHHARYHHTPTLKPYLRRGRAFATLQPSFAQLAQ